MFLSHWLTTIIKELRLWPEYWVMEKILHTISIGDQLMA